jgi:2-haloacid dehalogenase
MVKILVFDVNETLLDLRALDPHFERVFGEGSIRQTWFNQFIQNALTATVAGPYQPFGKIGRGALEMVADRQGRLLSEEEKMSILNELTNLPPHAEVIEALTSLQNAGAKLVTLTNSTELVVQKQIANAGLQRYFERTFSADTVQRLKPAPDPYQLVAREMGVSIQETRLIAAHAWDIAGALQAGCTAAFVARPGMVLDPLYPKPDIIGADLKEIAEKILATDFV